MVRGQKKKAMTDTTPAISTLLPTTTMTTSTSQVTLPLFRYLPYSSPATIFTPSSTVGRTSLSAPWAVQPPVMLVQLWFLFQKVSKINV